MNCCCCFNCSQIEYVTDTYSPPTTPCTGRKAEQQKTMKIILADVQQTSYYFFHVIKKKGKSMNKSTNKSQTTTFEREQQQIKMNDPQLLQNLAPLLLFFATSCPFLSLSLTPGRRTKLSFMAVAMQLSCCAPDAGKSTK